LPYGMAFIILSCTVLFWVETRSILAHAQETLL